MKYGEFLPKAEEIAEQAAAIALSYFRQSLLIEIKENDTPVTIADKKTEEFIRRELERVFPGHGMIGEEFGLQNPQAEYLWTIDPIDGTRSFIRGIPLFGTLLGLLHRKKPVLGVVVLPALNETYGAAQGHGAFFRGNPLRVSPISALESAILSCGDISCFQTVGKRERLNQLIERCHLLRMYTDCFGHALVIRGAVEAMIDPIVSLWDVVPIACLVEEAGGEYFNFEGEASVESSSFISSTPALKEKILEVLFS